MRWLMAWARRACCPADVAALACQHDNLASRCAVTDRELANLRDRLTEAERETDRLRTVNEVLAAQNELLWKLNERNAARIDMERATFVRKAVERTGQASAAED